MQRFTRRIIFPLVLTAPAALAGVGKNEVRYLGGMWKDVP